MAFTRTSPVDFSLSEPLYATATVTAYQADPVTGAALATLAPLYDSVAGTGLLQNPQKLDSSGKFAKPVYIDQPVIFTVTNLLGGIPSHSTGVVGTNLAADAAASAATSAAAALSYMGIAQKFASLVKAIFTKIGALPQVPFTFPGYAKSTSAVASSYVALATLRTDVAGGASSLIIDPANAGTLTTSEPVNPQAGAAYPVAATDRAKLVVRSNAGAMADTIAQAGTGNFVAGWSTDIFVPPTSPGSVTLTPTTSTINGATTLVIAPGTWAHIVSDGANYQAEIGGYQPVAGGLKNVVIGGDFSVNPWQRGVTIAGTAAKAYAADRFWSARLAGLGGGFTLSQIASADNAFPLALRIQRTAADASVNPITVGTDLESINSKRFQGKNVTLAIRARKGANLSGTCTLALVYGTGTDQSLSGGYTGQTTIGSIDLTTLTANFTTVVLANQAVPAAATQLGLLYTHTPAGAAGAADLVDFEIIQLEEGQVFTGFERRLSHLEELLCGRYTWKRTSLRSSLADGTGSALVLIVFPVNMRAVPTVTISNVSAGTFSSLGAGATAGCVAVVFSGVAAGNAAFFDALASAEL